MAKYKLYKKPGASDEFSLWGTFDTDNEYDLKAMLRSTYDFGRFCYSDFRIEKVEEDEEA